ncbi:MAG TPA: S8 family serine peptidase [Lentimicrobium sp.]|jgi:subtilisin family serine protease|nr:S8 family serine peptidase [Lentimicrobium sp.]
MSRFLLLPVLLSLLALSVSAQKAKSYYMLKLNDKSNSSYSISDPSAFLSAKSIERRLVQRIPVNETDLPVSPAYLEQIKAAGAEVVYTSKWLNTVIIHTDEATLKSVIAAKPFILDVKEADHLFRNRIQHTRKAHFENERLERISNRHKEYKSTGAFNYGPSGNQAQMISIDQLHSQGFTGKGITIGVIDAGFNSVNTLAAFDSIRANGQILGTRDFVQPGNNVYATNISTHGMMVLSTMGGNLPGQIVGTAPHSAYWLLRSEDATAEYLMEEYYWVNAAEFADSVGVDVINSSLGYNTFDNPAENHTYADMDGNTTPVTIGADMAAAKGILVVNSAGNSGSGQWQFITAPADGDSVFTIGAVDANGLYASFSSRGPTSDGRTKPDVTAQGQSTIVATIPSGVAGGSGTSFSSPIIAGAAACLWQANPTMSNMDLMHAIKMSASQASNPDNQKGWGIPNFSLANNLLTNSLIQIKHQSHSVKTFPNPFSSYVNVEITTDRSIVVDIRIINSKGTEVVAMNGIEVSKGKNLVVLQNLERLTNGIYMITVSDGYFVSASKVIK